MRNDVSFEKTRAFKSKPKLFYEKFFYFVSIALGSLHSRCVFSFCYGVSFVLLRPRVIERRAVLVGWGVQNNWVLFWMNEVHRTRSNEASWPCARCDYVNGRARSDNPEVVADACLRLSYSVVLLLTNPTPAPLLCILNRCHSRKPRCHKASGLFCAYFRSFLINERKNATWFSLPQPKSHHCSKSGVFCR